MVLSLETEDEAVLWWRTVRQGRWEVQGGVWLVGNDDGGLGGPDSPGRGGEVEVVTDDSPAGGGGTQGLAHH